MKRTTLAAAALIACGVLLAACGAPAPAANSDTAQVADAAQAPDQQPGAPGPGQGGPRGGFGNRVRAPELPTSDPMATGAIMSHTGNTLMIRTGFGFGPRGQGQTPGAPQADPNSTPPAPMDVEVNSSTKIYSDTTQFDLAAAQSGQPIQQTVALVSSLDALNIPADGASANSGNANGGTGRGSNEGTVQVWGDSSSGKLVASVLVYSHPRARPQNNNQNQGG